MSVRSRTKKSSRKRSNLALRLMLIAVAAFLFFKLVQMHVQIQETQQKWIDLNNSKNHQILINEDLSQQVSDAENVEDILEREANEAGLFRPGQQIYQGSAG